MIRLANCRSAALSACVGLCLALHAHGATAATATFDDFVTRYYASGEKYVEDGINVQLDIGPNIYRARFIELIDYYGPYQAIFSMDTPFRAIQMNFGAGSFHQTCNVGLGYYDVTDCVYTPQPGGVVSIDGTQTDGTVVGYVFGNISADLGFGPEFDNLTSLSVTIFPRQGPKLSELYGPPNYFTGPVYGDEGLIVPPGLNSVYDCQKVCVGATITSLTLEPIGAPAPNAVAPVPLPASLPLSALGLIALGLIGRRRASA